jgi:hypothetical protein
MYPIRLNRSIATLLLCSLWLQGCRSSFQITSGEPVLKKLRKTSDHVPSTDQVAAPDAQSSTFSDVLHCSLSTAGSASLPSGATLTLQTASPTRRLAMMLDTAPSCQQVLSTDLEATDAKPAARPLVCQATRWSPAGRPASLRTRSLDVPAPIFGAQAWRRYFGEVGTEPPLPSDINQILSGPCPFWSGQSVQDTHLLVLIPSTVNGSAFTLDLLGELIQTPHRGGHSTQYFLYDDEVQQSLGEAYPISSYWVLLTREVLPGSRNKPYTSQRGLVAAQSSQIDAPCYELPQALEVATAILSHYVRSGERLYEGVGTEDGPDAGPSTSTRCTEWLADMVGHSYPVTVGRFCSRGLVFLSGFGDDAEFGVSCLRTFGTRHYRSSALLDSFGGEEWRRYFGEVGEVPPYPAHLVATLKSSCPFWPGKLVKDTHLLVLIPSRVSGEPFSLNLLEKLIKHPKGGGYPTAYRFYGSDVRAALGAQSPESAYWVLMTRKVLAGSRRKDYASQKALIAAHASETGLPYELPGALEAATVMLSHYVRTGERLYSDSPLTYTRFRELVGNECPAVVGGFSYGGPHVSLDSSSSYVYVGVAGLRKF